MYMSTYDHYTPFLSIAALCMFRAHQATSPVWSPFTELLGSKAHNKRKRQKKAASSKARVDIITFLFPMPWDKSVVTRFVHILIHIESTLITSRKVLLLLTQDKPQILIWWHIPRESRVISTSEKTRRSLISIIKALTQNRGKYE